MVPARLRSWSWPLEAALALAAAAATTLAVHALVAGIDFRATSPDAAGLGPVWAAAMIALAVGAYVVQRRVGRPRIITTIVSLLAGAAAALVMTPMMAGLHGTSQPLYTLLRGDMSFRTEYVTRFAATWHLRDYTLRGLNAFYPPAWFWLAGRTAHVLGIAPWRIVKPFAIGTMGAALLLGFALWRMVLTPAGALSAAIGSSLVLTTQVPDLSYSTQAWYSPYSCFVAVTGAAWLAAALVNARGGGSRGRLAVLAVVGTLLALCYYLLFLILVAVLVVLGAASGPPRRAVLARLAACLGAIAALTAVFWIPLLSAVLGGVAAQGHYVRPDFLHVSIGLDGPTALTLLAAVAIVLLVLTVSSSASQAVAGLLLGTIAYQLISVTTLVLAHNQLQPHRAVTMMWATFGAAVPVALEGAWRVVPRALPRVALALAVPPTFVLGAALGSALAAGPLTVAAHTRLDLAPSLAISRFITQVTGKRPQQLTVLTEDHALLVTQPYYDFLPLRARYAHPAARVAQRIGVLRAASACPDAGCTERTLEDSSFGPIDALVLAREGRVYRVDGQEDAFPDPREIPILFRRNQLPQALWTRRRIGDYAVFVPVRAATSRS